MICVANHNGLAVQHIEGHIILFMEPAIDYQFGIEYRLRHLIEDNKLRF